MYHFLSQSFTHSLFGISVLLKKWSKSCIDSLFGNSFASDLIFVSFYQFMLCRLAIFVIFFFFSFNFLTSFENDGLITQGLFIINVFLTCLLISCSKILWLPYAFFSIDQMKQCIFLVFSSIESISDFIPIANKTKLFACFLFFSK